MHDIAEEGAFETRAFVLAEEGEDHEGKQVFLDNWVVELLDPIRGDDLALDRLREDLLREQEHDQLHKPQINWEWELLLQHVLENEKRF